MDIAAYKQARRDMVEQNENLVGIILNEKERRADAILQEMKQEVKTSCGPLSYDFSLLTDARLRKTRLYAFSKAIPKGSELHVHGTALLPVHKLVDFLLTEEGIVIDPETMILHLPSDPEADECLPLREAFYQGLVSRKQLEKVWTILGAEDSDPWLYFENLFSYFDAIDRDTDVLRRYYLKAFSDCIENGIFHIEIHGVLPEDPEEADNMLIAIRDSYYQVRREHPELSVSFIGCGMKMFLGDTDATQKLLDYTEDARRRIRDEFDPEAPCDFVLGFDLVNEEDRSRPLSEFAPLLIDFKEKNPGFRYFLHCGESLDAESDYLFDAYMINADRVGHGMNLYRYPALLKAYADKEICLEACPVSNCRLGYTKDIRLHPAMEYLKRGVTVALCSDDPNFFEYEILTDDYFAGILSWNLGIAEIKQLCLNSILYSGMQKNERSLLLRNWRKAWDDFLIKITDM